MEYEEIRKATGNFGSDHMLGEGSSSRVYKGWIDKQSLTAVKPEFGIPVAVRIMNASKDLEFQKKKWMVGISSSAAQFFKSCLHKSPKLLQDEISHLRHPNLFRPIGYCFNTDHTILVYKFMRKGSLDNRFFERKLQPLPWETRIKVAVGAAKGLAFLHSLEKPVMHHNIKCSTIFLDDDFNAKLRDFDATLPDFYCDHYDLPPSVSELHPSELSRRFGLCISGTYLSTGSHSTTSDVYSFGVVLVELISGRRALDRNRPQVEHNLIHWAKPYLGDERRLSRIMDIRIEGQYPHKQACEVAQLALRCVSSDPRSRPNMDEVVSTLQQL